MILINFIKFIVQLFSSGKDQTLIGLSGLKETREPVLQEIIKPVNTKNIKLSDLMKGAEY
jgi:hypothetical protein